VFNPIGLDPSNLNNKRIRLRIHGCSWQADLMHVGLYGPIPDQSGEWRSLSFYWPVDLLRSIRCLYCVYCL